MKLRKNKISNKKLKNLFIEKYKLGQEMDFAILNCSAKFRNVATDALYVYFL